MKESVVSSSQTSQLFFEILFDRGVTARHNFRDIFGRRMSEEASGKFQIDLTHKIKDPSRCTYRRKAITRRTEQF